MVLMGLVLFGFMYCNRPDNTQQTNTSTQQNVAQKDTAPDLEKSLTPEFEASMAEMVRKYGVNDGQGTFSLKAGHIDITATNDTATFNKIAGAVVVGKTEINVTEAFDLTDTLVTAEQRMHGYKAL